MVNFRTSNVGSDIEDDPTADIEIIGDEPVSDDCENTTEKSASVTDIDNAKAKAKARRQSLKFRLPGQKPPEHTRKEGGDSTDAVNKNELQTDGSDKDVHGLTNEVTSVRDQSSLNQRVTSSLEELKSILYRVQARIFTRNLHSHAVNLQRLRNKLHDIKKLSTEAGLEDTSVQSALVALSERESIIQQELTINSDAFENNNISSADKIEISANIDDWNRVSGICFDLNSIILSGHALLNTSKCNSPDRNMLASFGYRSSLSIVRSILSTEVSIPLLLRKIDELLEEATTSTDSLKVGERLTRPKFVSE